MRRWVVVLVSPKEAGNVGAAARVTLNFGASGLRIVAPRCEVNSPEARRFSAGAGHLLRGAEVFDSLPEAVADRELVVGLTGVSGKHHPLDATTLVPTEVLRESSHLTRCALVFGREERGMEGPELESCNVLWSLPTNPEFPSLNLAQAIGVALAGVREAERIMGNLDHGRGLAPSNRALTAVGGGNWPGDRPATHEEMQLLIAHFDRLMRRTGWDGDRRLIGSLSKIRGLLTRGRATQREVNLFHGVCRQAMNAINHPDRFPPLGDDKGALRELPADIPQPDEAIDIDHSADH